MLVPERAWLNANPFYLSIYKPSAAKNRFRNDVAKAIHDALPDAVLECLVDELMQATEYGDQLQFLIKNQVDPAIKVVLDEVKKLAVPYTAADGTQCLMVPVNKLDSLLP